jgi:hypothetical protein
MAKITISPIHIEGRNITIYQIDERGGTVDHSFMSFEVDTPEKALEALRRPLKQECRQQARDQLHQGQIALIDLDVCVETDR